MVPEFSRSGPIAVVQLPSVLASVPVFTNDGSLPPPVMIPDSELALNVPEFLISAPDDAHPWPPENVSVPSLTSERPARNLFDAPLSVADAPDKTTVEPAPDIVPPDHDTEPDTLTVAAPASVPPDWVSVAIRDDSSELKTSREPPETFSAPSPWTTAASALPPETTTVFPEPMHATSVEPGTCPADQSATVDHSPSAGPVHVSVQGGSADAPAGTNIKTSTTNAVRAPKLPNPSRP